MATEAVALGQLGVVTPGAPRVVEPSKEVELRGEVHVPHGLHLGCAGGLRNLDTALDLVEPALVADAATGTPDDDVQARALLDQAEFVDERPRHRAQADRLLVATAEHEEARLLRQRERM